MFSAVSLRFTQFGGSFHCSNFYKFRDTALSVRVLSPVQTESTLLAKTSNTVGCFMLRPFTQPVACCCVVIGSCCIRLHTTANMVAATPSIVGYCVHLHIALRATLE